MKILLLGTTGLLGHNVLRQLLYEGHEVVALVRRPEKVLIHDQRVTIKEGNLDAKTITQAAWGCDAIINCAGVTDMSLLRYEEYLPINAALTEVLTGVMKSHGIRILVHTSTANTIGYGTPARLADERDEMAFPFGESYYALSKKLGEEHLQKAAAENPDWHVVIVNPGFMIGDYDVRPSSGTLLLAGYRKPLMAAPGGGKSFVAARDAATAIVNALTMGISGERYLLTGTNLTLKEFYGLQARAMGYRQRMVVLPDPIVAIAGRVGDLVRRCGIRTQLSTRNVRQLMVTEHYDNHKAVGELKMPQTPIEDAIRDFFGWWYNNNQNPTLSNKNRQS